MKLASINVDEQGHSYFGEVESADKDDKERQMNIAHWQLWQTQPGHFVDFKPTEEPKCIVMMSGKIEITVSSGEKRYFSRGDTFLVQDIKGKGHAHRTIGAEPCNAMVITMPTVMSATAA
ncbi:MAG: DUF861 domain-containing protein [Rhodospirillaceae bacterium]|nr:DUF861 domain-containing protein [Rhodospirillaceae bacterium]